MAVAEIHVTLKPSLFDAQGAQVLKALHQLGHSGVKNARLGKYITLELEGDPASMQGQLDLMCQQLLANPVIENYEITLSDDAGATLRTTPATSSAPTAVAGEFPADFAAGAAHLSGGFTAAPAAVLTARSAGGAHVAASTSMGVEPLSTAGGMTISDPFALDYATYDGMTTEAKLSLRSLALQRYGAWINGQIARLGAAWVLCVGHTVVEVGDTLDSYPGESHLDALGRAHNLVPWVFTRPPA